MTELSQSRMDGAPVFTADDHLWVQVEIEKRAHRLWRAGGCRESVALSDWLQAEGEVLEQFILAFAQRHSEREAKAHLAQPRKGTNLKTKQSHNALPKERGQPKEADSPARAAIHLKSAATKGVSL